MERSRYKRGGRVVKRVHLKIQEIKERENTSCASRQSFQIMIGLSTFRARPPPWLKVCLSRRIQAFREAPTHFLEAKGQDPLGNDPRR